MTTTAIPGRVTEQGAVAPPAGLVAKGLGDQ